MGMDHSILSKDQILEQYASEGNLQKRYRFHQRYGTNKGNLDDWLFQHYSFMDGYKVLELGCGDGRVWETHMDKLPPNLSLVLSDFSLGMLDKVKEKYGRYSNVTFQRIDIEDVPYEDCSFDCVIANSMLYHVPNLQKAIREVWRVLKSGGVFYAATYGENGLHDFIHHIINEMNPEGGMKANKRFTLENGERWLGECFKHIEVHVRNNDLKVTDVWDLVEFILTMPYLMDMKIDKKELYSNLKGKKDEKGVITIPNPFGTFIAIK